MTSPVMEKFIKEEFSTYVPRTGQIIKGIITGKKGISVFVDIGVYGTGVIFGAEYYSAREMLKGLGIGDEIEVKIKDIENEEGLVELSLKEAGEDTIFNDLKRKADTKEVFAVKIKGANKGGLTADVAGILAFLPVSQLGSKNYPRMDAADPGKIAQELLKFVGTEMQVKILTFDPTGRRIILSEREIELERIREILKQLKVGDTVEGKVSGVTDFGIFLRFKVADTGTNEQFDYEGLIHQSEVSAENAAAKDSIKAGNKLSAKIIAIEGDRVYLSIK